MKRIAMTAMVVATLIIGSAPAWASRAPNTYPLGSAKSCKAHHVERILKHKVKGKTEQYIGCVYVAPKKARKHQKTPRVLVTTTTTTVPPTTTTTTTPAGPTLTQQQQSAAASAEQYLNFEGFSQQGLIDQLDSKYGSGYSVNDATVAVDSLSVNWNTEAVRVAKQYLATEPFSCNNLIQQLDSPYGGKFTVAQATYGATQAGDC